ncbi:MAG: IS4 family transposase [Chromatiaceae bacterium]|nr:IS4 family transposase [Chromatiaceae bacterium]
MFSAEFAARARLTPAAFTRQRELPLAHLVGLLLNLRKGSLQDEVNGFWEVLTGQPLATGVSAAALCKARQKLDPYALWGLNERLLGAFAEAFPVRRWHGLRVLATDGSTLRLPRSPEVIAHFGAPPSGSTIPLGRLSQLVDVLNGVVVDAELDAYDVGERVLASEHLEATAPQDLVLYDRGYPAFWLFARHYQLERHFCARLPLGFSTEVTAFLASGARSAVITLTPTPEARQPCRRYEIPPDPLHVRLVRVTLANGETEVLATSLLSEQDWPSPWFKGLYHLRWGAEEAYKCGKLRLELENFSGLSVRVVLQDCFAKLFTVNLTAICTWVAQVIATARYRQRRREYRVNFAHALSGMKNTVVRLLVGTDTTELLTSLILAMAMTVEAVRPDRSFPRNMKPAKLQGFHRNYKRCR